MCILIMNRIRAIVAGIGFIVMGVLLSGVLPPHVLPAVQMFRGEIFKTNCLLMCTCLCYAQLPRVHLMGTVYLHHLQVVT